MYKIFQIVFALFPLIHTIFTKLSDLRAAAIEPPPLRNQPLPAPETDV
jgi:hypothetical protein